MAHREHWHNVYACDHLWSALDRGEQKARQQVADAAFDFVVDLGENVALCEVCAQNPVHITVAKRQVRLATHDKIEQVRPWQP